MVSYNAYVLLSIVICNLLIVLPARATIQQCCGGILMEGLKIEK